MSVHIAECACSECTTARLGGGPMLCELPTSPKPSPKHDVMEVLAHAFGGMIAEVMRAPRTRAWRGSPRHHEGRVEWTDRTVPADSPVDRVYVVTGVYIDGEIIESVEPSVFVDRDAAQRCADRMIEADPTRVVVFGSEVTVSGLQPVDVPAVSGAPALGAEQKCDHYGTGILTLASVQNAYGALATYGRCPCGVDLMQVYDRGTVVAVEVPTGRARLVGG